jgi:bifunctional DNA-binding transcriptional regulator/antitoxin component of YhaV-PrlF toxin-antitoxin module
VNTENKKYQVVIPYEERAVINAEAVSRIVLKEEAEIILTSIKNGDYFTGEIIDDYLFNYDSISDTYDTELFENGAYIKEVPSRDDCLHVTLSIPLNDFDMTKMIKTAEEEFNRIGLPLRIRKLHFSPVSINCGVCIYKVYPQDYDNFTDGISIKDFNKVY